MSIHNDPLKDENPIKIVGYVEIIDNLGNTEKYSEQETFKLLTTPDEWTDDQIFLDPHNRGYFIDELIGKQVTCGPMTFTVQED